MAAKVASLRAHLLILMLGTLLPMVILGIIGAVLIVQREKAVVERGARERTLALLTAVDAELNGLATSLRLLAGSRNLEVENLRGFHDEIVRMLPTQPDWRSVSLSDLSGQRILDSQYPYGTDVPPILDAESFQSLIRDRKPVVGDLFVADGEYEFAVRVLVTRHDSPQYVLSALVDPRAILTLLTLQRLPESWVGVVLDRNDRVVARTMNHEGSLGQLGSESLRAALLEEPEGWFHGTTLEGAEVYTPYNRSPYSGWTVALGIPASVVEAGASRAVSMLALSVLIAAVLAIIFATIVSRRISSPITSLAAAARALGGGQPLSAPNPGSVREIHEVSAALIDAARAVREREEALRAADRAKDDFLAMLGHELRNPLSALSSASQVLQLSVPEEGPASRATAVIDRQVQHMTRLVDDLLDVSRVTSGKVKLSRRPLDLGELVKATVRDFRASGRLDGHDVQVDTAPVWIHADEARVEQIVSNLLGNAVKYTPRGGWIQVRVYRRNEEAVLEITDSGAGLSPELLSRVFDLFVQGDQSLDRGPGGLGVGLTLVRRLAELHGGRASASSEGAGCGSRFTVSLPATEAPSEQGVQPALAREASGASRIVLIEDNADARQTLQEALRLYGYEVIDSGDGATGLELASVASPDAAVIDIGLPGIDGYEVARRLRATPSGSSMLLIAISGYGQPEARRRAFDAGFDQYLTKPVSPEVLAKLIAAGRGVSRGLSA